MAGSKFEFGVTGGGQETELEGGNDVGTYTIVTFSASQSRIQALLDSQTLTPNTGNGSDGLSS